MGVVMKGRERMWVEDIHCKGMGVVMKGRERRCERMNVSQLIYLFMSYFAY